MRFVVFRSDGASEPGIVVGDGIVPLNAIWSDVMGVPYNPAWPESYESLHDSRDALVAAAKAAPSTTPMSEVVLEAPTLFPRKILCIGLNYTDHVEEVGLPSPPRPHVFSKLSTAINDPLGAVAVPWAVASEIDYEAELALVVGRRCRNVPVDRALDCVLGYTVANDISARDWQFAPDGQLTLGKGFDGFFPIGPSIVTPDELPDTGDLRIRCWVDDELRQDASTSQMVAGPAEIVAFLSQVCTLEPGDVIATGTPAGVGFGQEPKVFLESGQVVRTEIEAIGTLINRIQ